MSSCCRVSTWREPATPVITQTAARRRPLTPTSTSASRSRAHGCVQPQGRCRRHSRSRSARYLGRGAQHGRGTSRPRGPWGTTAARARSRPESDAPVSRPSSTPLSSSSRRTTSNTPNCSSDATATSKRRWTGDPLFLNSLASRRVNQGHVLGLVPASRPGSPPRAVDGRGLRHGHRLDAAVAGRRALHLLRPNVGPRAVPLVGTSGRVRSARLPDRGAGDDPAAMTLSMAA